jgi:hypothetical protein
MRAIRPVKRRLDRAELKARVEAIRSGERDDVF